MIYLPQSTLSATWLTKPVVSKGKPSTKHYILAQADGYLVRVFNRPDGTFMANAVAGTGTGYDRKIAEKVTKDYQRVSFWDLAAENWGLTKKNFTMPIVVGMRSKTETLVTSTTLRAHNFKDTFDQITLEIYSTTGGALRIDHYESAQPNNWLDQSQLGFPLWQTLFSDKVRADETLREVVLKKCQEGYYVHHSSNPLPHAQIGLSAQYPIMPLTADAFSGIEDTSWF